MALVHNNLLSVYSGVSTQAIEIRQPNHCEDMTNCFPSIQNGIRRRSGTVQIADTITPEENQFMHTYDRGLSGESQEQYLITIDKTNGLKVLDINDGTYKTVTLDSGTDDYIESSNAQLGFSAVTVRDTTIIANKDISPRLIGSSTTATAKLATISFNGSGYSSGTTVLSFYDQKKKEQTKLQKVAGLSPCRIRRYLIDVANTSTDFYVESSAGSTITFTIDGKTIKYTSSVRTYGYSKYPETMSEWRMNIANAIQNNLDANNYIVSIGTNNSIKIYKLDGTAISISYSLTIPSSVSEKPIYLGKKIISTTELGTFGTTGYITGVVQTTASAGIKISSSYDSVAHMWIKQTSVDNAYPYTFYLTLKETNGTTISTVSSNATSTVGVASAIASAVNALADFTASSDGSVVKIIRDSGTGFIISSSDTYGSQASISWKGSVTSMNDLPKTFPFQDTIVKIDGIQKSDDIAYWVKYSGNTWIEWRDPNRLYKLDRTTMPHKLVRQSDGSFKFSQIEWSDMLVGDSDTQPEPNFINSSIRDLFFINGRLGMITKNGINLSQQGRLENFFRTTVLDILDDSAITTFVDSTKSVGLEFAVELQGAVILFGDKQQFALDANKAITPKQILIQPISGFEINKNVKPITFGDSVYFVANKGTHASVYEMSRDTLSTSIRANNIASHIDGYIDGDIVQIVGSVRSNAIFLLSRRFKNTVYVCKQHIEQNQKVQIAWSKWTFNMEIESIFSFEDNLYLFGKRYDTTIPIEDYPLSIFWNDDNNWNDSTLWLEDGVSTSNSFEKMLIEPYYTDVVVNDVNDAYFNSSVVLSEWSISASSANSQTKEMRGTLLFKTIQIESEDGSVFELLVRDKERMTERSIPSEYTVNRKPFISGNASNMEIEIRSKEDATFQINAISFEGQYNVRSKRL